MTQVDAALEEFARNRSSHLDDLKDLCTIPGISASSPEDVRRSAEAVARLLVKHGVGDVRLLEIESAHPSVYGSVDVGADAPTLLIYGHHDVQPVGRVERWTTPPFEPVEREGRLYGRGTSDDKGGVMAHVAAVASYRGKPPCNIRFFIEGEEEIGSPNLPKFLERYGEMLRADAIILCDSPNFDTGVPALTYRLRGLCTVDVEARCLARPLHSGRGAGAAPDPYAVLSRIIASLDLSDIPFEEGPHPDFGDEDEDRFRRTVGVLDGVALTGGRLDTWFRPAATVIGIDASPVEKAFNQIAESARARISVRTVPPLSSRETGERVVEKIAAIPAPDAIVSARIVSTAPWWRSEGKGPLIDAARRALTRGYGTEALMMASGGTIGFVGTFADAFPRAPLLLMGIEDPPCNAHSENESLHLGDWEKCARSSIFLYDELSRAARRT